MSIKSEELRVGNILKEGKIKSIYYDNTVGLDDSNTYHLEDLNSIPLTEDWLKRFGFVYHGVEGFSCDEKSTLKFYFSTGNGLMCNIFYRRTTPSDNVKGCFYVHQLQNLYFALTGEDLKLN